MCIAAPLNCICESDCRSLAIDSPFNTKSKVNGSPSVSLVKMRGDIMLPLIIDWGM